MAVARTSLLKQLAMTPQDKHLLGAVPEYDLGGDQEVELCECDSECLPTGAPQL